MIQTFSQFPWIGGVNTSLDPSTIPANQLLTAKNPVFGVRGSRKKRDGIDYDWDDATNGTDSVVGQHDFWYGATSRTQRRVAVTSGKAIYSYTAGARSANLFGGSTWASAVTTATLLSFTNLCLIAVDGTGNTIKKWSGTGNVVTLGTTSEVSQVVVTADTAGSLSGKYFDLEDEAGTVRVWYNNGSSIAPSTPTGGRLLVVTYTNGDANTAIGTKTKTALDSDAKFTTSLNTATLTITCVQKGARTDVAVGTSGFTVSVVTQGEDAPLGSILQEHIGRVWCNDKTNLDRVHYSTTANAEEWLGYGDSGALDIGIGDGDPDGITAIYPTFKGELFVAKRTKLYRISGYTPEEFSVTLVSSGIGCVSHNSITPADQDDLYYISERGVHSLLATQNYGDFEGQYVSFDIQGTFNEKWVKTRLKYTHGIYLAQLNSIAFAVTDNDYGLTANNCVWLYNIPLKSWYCWPNLSCESMIAVRDTDKVRPYFGSNTTRIGKGLNGTNYDVSTSGTITAIPFETKTGFIYPTNDPNMSIAFKWFSLLYKPVGTHQITVTIKIDNYTVQTLSFSETGSTDVLDSTFILDSSVLDYEVVLAPYRYPIDGFGRSIQITVEQTGNDMEAEIQGFSFGYEPAQTQQEVNLN